MGATSIKKLMIKSLSLFIYFIMMEALSDEFSEFRSWKISFKWNKKLVENIVLHKENMKYHKVNKHHRKLSFE